MVGGEVTQRFHVLGREYDAHSDELEQALAGVYENGPRPRCLCRSGGVEMYVARHGRFVVKRMPETGAHHHPSCPSYEPEPAQSGLGELLGDALLEPEPGRIELRVAFPWAHILGAGPSRSGHEGEPAADVATPRRRMSLRAVAHYLFERAGFNRWTPAMRGKRHQAVLHRYLLEAACDIVVKGERLAQRLYVPEAFNERTRDEVARRRQAQLTVLQPTQGRLPMVILIGEFKAAEPFAAGMRVWVKHMPDVPLWVERRAWVRIERAFAPVLEAQCVDSNAKPRPVLVALIRARREHLYEIDTACLMLVSAQWIPIEGVHELPLIEALIAQERRFIKPLRYDASVAGQFPNALLLDVGAPFPLHLSSPFLPAAEQSAKSRALAAERQRGGTPWVWVTPQPMPALPPPLERVPPP